MRRQVQYQPGRRMHPVQGVLLVSALLAFIFTVVYRMIKSQSIANALAMLFESLVILAFFIFLGTFVVYFLYFLYEKVRSSSHRRDLTYTFHNNSAKRQNESISTHGK